MLVICLKTTFLRIRIRILPPFESVLSLLNSMNRDEAKVGLVSRSRFNKDKNVIIY